MISMHRVLDEHRGNGRQGAGGEIGIGAQREQVGIERRLARRLVLAASVFFFVSLLSPALVHAAGPGVEWEKMTLDQALLKAKDKNRIVMIDVFSDHCMQCKDMDEQFWSTAEGARLADDLIPLQIMSDGPEGAQLGRRFPILGLPAVLFIGPDGKEIGRVVGFRGVQSFLDEALGLKSGIDPLPAVEADLAAQPGSFALMANAVEEYLFRKREDQARELLDKMVAADKQRTSIEVTRAMSSMGKYYEYFKQDGEAALTMWKSIVELYPTSAGVASGINGSCKIAVSWGKTADWIDWICGIGAKYPDDGRLHYNIAMIAYRQGLKHACLAASARKAIEKKVGPPNMGEIAAALEGKS